ncbi:MAG: fumarylacetoacetate hydrolase family protein [Dysgonamonadaceae bacterium]|jgi:2-keto-4-pentenoate hydratase/2-oxohepta-3-ene-1,7-dioic acid hydratase in catechol pathway|nr:fumarylacetoacetate hydrolase family protein [Dysgonamonadaceae bacterium]
MKIICVAKNYRITKPSEPVVFLKPDSSLLKDGKPFFIPDFSSDLRGEIEIVVKISRLGKNIAPRFAHRYYEEVTAGIDLTACDLLERLQSGSLPWEMSKAFDNSAIIGNFVALKTCDADVNHLPFHLNINEKRVQEGHTENQLFSIDEIIAYVSRFFTLKIGDLIFTGAPSAGIKLQIDDHLQGYIGENRVLDFFVK